MKIRVTVTDNFYKKGEEFFIHTSGVKKPTPFIKWRCYVVISTRLALVDIRHAEIIENE